MNDTIKNLEEALANVSEVLSRAKTHNKSEDDDRRLVRDELACMVQLLRVVKIRAGELKQTAVNLRLELQASDQDVTLIGRVLAGRVDRRRYLAGAEAAAKAEVDRGKVSRQEHEELL